jgi:hypothetical protein
MIDAVDAFFVKHLMLSLNGASSSSSSSSSSSAAAAGVEGRSDL